MAARARKQHAAPRAGDADLPLSGRPLTRLRDKAHRVTVRLHATHGSPRHNNKKDPVDEIVFIVLSQMTTTRSFNRVFDRMKESVHSWDRLLAMPLRKTMSLIRDAGLSQQKGPRLRTILRRIKNTSGHISLEGLRDKPDEEVLKFLTSLPGVGVKTAKCVMMYSLDRTVLPVDTHVGRLAQRLGLCPPGPSYARSHDAVERAVRPPDRYSFHVNGVAHGQQVCHALRPRCSVCPLKRMCLYYRGTA